MSTKLKFKVTTVNGMRVTTFRINQARLSGNELDDFKSATNPNEIEGELDVTLISDSVEVSVAGVGTPNLSGSFNITYNDKKFFSEDQKLIVRSKGRFRFYMTKVKIPF